MTSQANITDYFNARKRSSAFDGAKSRAKVLILEAQKSLATDKCQDVTPPKVVFQKSQLEVRTCPKSKPKVTKKTSSKSTGKGKDQLKQSLLTNFTVKPTPQTSLSLEDSSKSSCDSVLEDTSQVLIPEATVSTPVQSPDVSPVKIQSTADNETASGSRPVRRSLFASTSGQAEASPMKSVTLGEISKKLKSSKKADKLRESLARFSSLDKQLQKVEAEDAALKLKQFTTIDVEVPLSPVRRVPFASPVKESPTLLTSSQLSPCKALGNRLAAWQQHRALAETRLPTLPLPWKLRSLEEIFRGIDVVSSMMLNRRETVTFDKLKPAVEKISKLNFSEQHLSQIKSMYPEAFSFKIEKRKTFALTGRADTYDLVITPNFDMQSEEGRLKVAPKVLQSRAEHFHGLLVKHVKTCHQEFLSHLDPPLVIDDDKVTRWHPGFDIEQVPTLESDSLPQAPNQNVLSSAQKVLDKAREMMSCNSRVVKALKAAACKSDEKPSVTNDTKEKQADSIPLNPAFRGIPAALLERVRAKQAARALEAMTRTPADDKKRTQLARLPELARILRTLFVFEKRSVMPLDMILDKLEHSYPHKMPAAELLQHLDLLTKEAPTLLQKLSMRQTIFLKLDRTVNMAGVMTQLEQHIKS